MTVHELSAPPTMAALYPRALTGVVRGGLRRLPGGTSDGGREPGLPDVELVVRDVAVDADHLAAYDRVCGFRVDDRLPVTYPHVLAFPVAMEIMTGPAFPFSVLGLVHIGNAMTQYRPFTVADAPTFTVRTGGLGPHERGTQFEVVSEASLAGEVVWRETSTYLARGEGGSGRSGRRERGRTPEPPHPTAMWHVPADIGRRYASVAGDRNPIHLSRWAAKAFGFPRAIAHGMWTKARCLAALGGRLPDAFAVEVRFKRPVLLPSRVGFEARREDSHWDLTLYDPKRGTPHLTGTIGPA
ncbi:MAG: MaoC family dehydratase [Streptosporangiaceae bacterium]